MGNIQDFNAIQENTFENEEQKTERYKKILTNWAMKKVMPAIKTVTNQPVWGWHGLEHTEQVVLFAIDYAIHGKVNPIPVILAAALHDCAREDDTYNELHGPLCVPLAKKFIERNFAHLVSEQDKVNVYQAILHHTDGKGGEAPSAVAACLWDADRTRLSWVHGYDETFFSTSRAKEIASMSKEKQRQYIQEQTAFLDKYNIPSLLSTRGRREKVKSAGLGHNQFRIRDGISR